MNQEKLIPLATLCTHFQVEMSFFDNLDEIGLIEIESVEQTHFIRSERLTQVEKILRMHRDLHLNPEGIDVVFNLLQKLENTQNELVSTRNRLKIYEY